MDITNTLTSMLLLASFLFIYQDILLLGKYVFRNASFLQSHDFGRTVKILRNLFCTRARLLLQYQKYSKTARAFTLPTLNGADIFLPIRDIELLNVTKQTELSVDSAHFDLLASDYTFQSTKIREPKVHQSAVRSSLRTPQSLDRLIPLIGEEIELAFAEAVSKHRSKSKEDGIETKKLHKVLEKTVTRAMNRILVGATLSRNEAYTSNAKAFTTTVPLASIVINMSPKWLQPLVGVVASLPGKYFHSRCARNSVPLIESKLRNEEHKRLTGEDEVKTEEQDDMTKTIIKHALRSGDPVESSPWIISLRIMLLTFASIFPSFVVLWNVVVDLVIAPPEAGFISGIRDEIERKKGRHADLKTWTVAELDSLWRLDSAVKETMRRSSPLMSAVMRTVSQPAGLTLADGTHAPHGSLIGMPMYSIHHDPEYYSNPESYDAFRFSRLREQEVGSNNASHSLTDTSRPEFLAFGTGVHACPGRNFAAIVIKLILIHLITKYDLETSVKEKPAHRFIGGVVLPPRAIDIGIRRRD